MTPSAPRPASHAKIDQARRNFLKRSAVGLITVSVGGALVQLSPREAKAQGVVYQVLTLEEVTTLEALGETLLPGAADAGIAAFIDSQLAAGFEDSLLMIRYMDVPPPHAPFYKGGLAALDGFARSMIEQPFHELDDEARADLVRAFQFTQPESWQGPPAPLFYFVTRADAVDVVYGTMEGYEKLDIPYMAHIEPPSKW